MATTKRWSDLTGTQQRIIVVVAALELAVTASALIDLARRPAQQLRGPKQLWLLGCFVQPVGPIAYLALGRRPGRMQPDVGTTTAPAAK
jgi:Phospholipase_D-nuclease N-terminal